MKKIFICFLLLFSGILLIQNSLEAQDISVVKQIIVGNGGLFETTPPFIDFVTMEKYDPVSKTTNNFDFINTQSVQDILIVGNHAFVAAQDSILEYDLDTYQRIAAVADSGLGRLGFYNNKLIVTKQAPIKRFFAEIFDAANNLGLLARVLNIPGECGGVIAANDSIYIAVNGGFLSTNGKLAVITPFNWTVVKVINFDTIARGMNDLYRYNDKIYTVNATPFGKPNTGSISTYDLVTGARASHSVGAKVGKSFGIVNNQLYLKFNDNVGSYNLDLNTISDTTIIQKPGGPLKFEFLAGAVDPVNNRLYLNVGNESAAGIGVVTSLTGDSITSFSEGIAADIIALDIRTETGINAISHNNDFVTLYPNPVGDNLYLNFNKGESISNIAVYTITGQKLIGQAVSGREQSLRIDCAALPSGIYFLRVTTGNGLKTKKFIKE